MAHQRKYTMPLRRKRKGKTNYKKRLALLKSRKDRLVIRPSLKNVTAQVVSYEADGDVIRMGVHSGVLRKMGWKLSCGNLPAAYLTGYLLGKKLTKEKPGHIIVDTGLLPVVRASRLFAVCKGVKDAGVDILVDDEMLPVDERVQGKHIADYLKDQKEGTQFSAYKKERISPDSIATQVSDVKKKIDAL